ncbi:hypothetical protein EI94DRAFT_1801903 [Lactarius quietus]|nr:hypothetical protein EI94DRAFT_1801903 [Lactarius quietus]
MANAALLDPVKGQGTSFDNFIKYVHFGPLPPDTATKGISMEEARLKVTRIRWADVEPTRE